MHVRIQMYPLLNSTCMRYRFGHQIYVIDFLPYLLLVPSSELELTIIVIDPHYKISNVLVIPLLKLATHFRSPLLNQISPPNQSLHHDAWTQQQHANMIIHNRHHFLLCTPTISPSPQHNKYDMKIY